MAMTSITTVRVPQKKGAGVSQVMPRQQCKKIDAAAVAFRTQLVTVAKALSCAANTAQAAAPVAAASKTYASADRTAATAAAFFAPLAEGSGSCGHEQFEAAPCGRRWGGHRHNMWIYPPTKWCEGFVSLLRPPRHRGPLRTNAYMYTVTNVHDFSVSK